MNARFWAIVRRFGGSVGVTSSERSREPWSAWFRWGDGSSEQITARGESPFEGFERLERLVVARFGSEPPRAA